MSEAFDTDARRAIRAAIARDAYHSDAMRIIDGDLTGCPWLVATHRGLYAVSVGGAKLVAHGWFFGIHKRGDTIYLFENCAMRDRTAMLGRVVQLDVSGNSLKFGGVLVRELHPNCHQLRIIDDLICLVDTANQRILRFDLDGRPVDVKQPILPIAEPIDTSGSYVHMNSLAKVGSGYVLMLHNGQVVPEKQSELAWLDENWQLTHRQSIEGHKAHDIFEDEDGLLWHCASTTGELISSDGKRCMIADEWMTRGISMTGDWIMVGICTFGSRQVREGLHGAVIILDRIFNKLARIELSGPPADIVAL